MESIPNLYRPPIWNLVPEKDMYDSVLVWVTELEFMEDMINDEVGENLTQARANMKNYFDKGKVDSKIGIGDLVLLKSQNRKSSLDQKFTAAICSNT